MFDIVHAITYDDVMRRIEKKYFNYCETIRPNLLISNAPIKFKWELGTLVYETLLRDLACLNLENIPRMELMGLPVEIINREGEEWKIRLIGEVE